MILHQKKREYIDSEAIRLIALLETTEQIITDMVPKKGSLANTIPLDWSDKLVASPITESTTIFGNTICKRECHQGKCVGFNESHYKEFQKLINNIYKDESVSSIASIEYLENTVFAWLIKSYKLSKIDRMLSDFLFDEIDSAIKEYEVYFPIFYLNIQEPISIGHVRIDFFRKEQFDILIADFKEKKPDEIENPFESLQKRHQGQVYAMYKVKAEEKKAQEMAYAHCALSVDVLKMCSDTTDAPPLILSYDIDKRTTDNAQNEIIVMVAGKPETWTTNLHRPPVHYEIGKKQIEGMNRKQINVFHTFLLSINPGNITELQQLIINGIKRYGNAISNKSLHQRIVELFTILESLLLLNKDSPIIDTVCKYSSKLVFKDIEQRKALIKLLKAMYEYRSNIIHHGQEDDIKIEDLSRFQQTVVMLLAQLIRKSISHRSKQSLLQEIDDAILQAY